MENRLLFPAGADRPRRGRRDRGQSFPRRTPALDSSAERRRWRLCRRQTVGRRAQPDQDIPQCRRRSLQRPVLQAQDRDDFTAGERVLEWLFPLHCGEAFGALGRSLVLLTGLAPLLLYVTGFLRWSHKRRARRTDSRMAHRNAFLRSRFRRRTGVHFCWKRSEPRHWPTEIGISILSSSLLPSPKASSRTYFPLWSTDDVQRHEAARDAAWTARRSKAPAPPFGSVL